MKKSNGVNHSMRINAKNRREKVIERLEAQLKLGTKIMCNKVHKLLGGTKTIGLNQSDIERINKEIETLKTRV